MCILHKRGKWTRFDKVAKEHVIFGDLRLAAVTQHWQKKECKKCGKVKHDYIGYTEL